MEYEVSVFEEEEGRWAYRVGSIYQPYDPDQPGEVVMDEARARECALAVKARLEE
jgi:hypothetical protein